MILGRYILKYYRQRKRMQGAQNLEEIRNGCHPRNFKEHGFADTLIFGPVKLIMASRTLAEYTLLILNHQVWGSSHNSHKTLIH